MCSLFGGSTNRRCGCPTNCLFGAYPVMLHSHCQAPVIWIFYTPHQLGWWVMRGTCILVSLCQFVCPSVCWWNSVCSITFLPPEGSLCDMRMCDVYNDFWSRLKYSRSSAHELYIYIPAAISNNGGIVRTRAFKFVWFCFGLANGISMFSVYGSWLNYTSTCTCSR